MICNAVVYEGNEPYLFVSCTAHDSALVGPILDQLGYDGYRIWFDEGSAEKDTMSSVMLEKVYNCAAFLAVITAGYAASHSCRAALNAAIESSRCIRILVLQEVVLPPSLRMQLAGAGCNPRFEAVSHALLIQKLYKDTAVKTCYAAGHSFYARKKKSLLELVKGKSSEEVSNTGIQKVSELKPEPKPKPEPEPEPKPDLSEEEETCLETEDGVETVLIDPLDEDDAEDNDDEKTDLINQQEIEGLLIRPATETIYRITELLTQLGRSQRKADIVLSGNTYIGNHHADIICYREKFYLRAFKAANGTFLDGERIQDGEQRPLQEIARFRLADEEFLFVSGNTARDLWKRGSIVLLKNKKTLEQYVLAENEIFLDRNHAWQGGTLNEETVSRRHAHLYEENKNWILMDVGSKNGTSINEGSKLEPQEKAVLKDGDSLKVGNTVIKVRILDTDAMIYSGKGTSESEA